MASTSTSSKRKNNSIDCYINDIRDYLTDKYGEVRPAWNLQLDMLKDDINMYIQCQRSIADNGIYNASTGRKNPLISTLKDLQATITKITTNLGVTPWSESKIKTIDEDDTDDFITALTGQMEVR